MKSQEETSMEVGMGRESVAIHSCPVLIREGKRSQSGSSVEPWEERETGAEKRLSSQGPCRRTFLKPGQALPGRS